MISRLSDGRPRGPSLPGAARDPMHVLSSAVLVLVRLIAGGTFVLILVTPAWWAAGRIQGGRAHPFFRLLCAAGLALTAYLAIVNIAGRLTESSILAVTACLLLNLAAIVVLFRRCPGELGLSSVVSSWRAWIPSLLLALVLGLPQWVLAVSTPFWDETASSAVHVTGPNQFAEGVFPPRHNAFPDLPIKYHYGFMILSGSVRLLTGLSANVGIDVASTALWLFVFLFVFWWFRELDLSRFAAAWAGFAALLGGGLAWLYLPRIEAYSTGGYAKVPSEAQLLHRYAPGDGWLANVAAVGDAPSLNLRNANGTLSSLPWDIAAQFQQHAVALGIALAVVALYLFTTWQARRQFHVPLFAANVVAFSLLFLGHAVFGGVGCVTAGICLLMAWLWERSRIRFLQGLFFVPCVSVLALLHGGLLATGPRYGAAGIMTMRKAFGYASGGFTDFIDWNVAGFGLPLGLTLVAWYVVIRSGSFGGGERGQLVRALTVFAAFSYLLPQFAFYSSETNGAEEFTEISKFFFCTHLAFALLSAFGIAHVRRFVHWSVLVPCFAAMAVVPLAVCHAASFDEDGRWKGFYDSPYVGLNHVEVQVANHLERLKKGPYDVYFDGSGDERTSGFLSAMLIHSGSVFTVTPARYERNGIGFRIAPSVVADRIRQSGRMTRLLPGAAEEAGCDWYIARPARDVTPWPVIVRSRFAKLVAEGYLVKRFEAGERQLFSFDRPTTDLDRGIEFHWQPRIVAPARWNADGRGRLLFHDPVGSRILAGDEAIPLPESMSGLVQVGAARLTHDARVDLLLARMADSDYRAGARVADIVERNDWMWARGDTSTGAWQPEFPRWSWISEIPLIADIDGSGIDVPIGYRPATGQWLSAAGPDLDGPRIDPDDLGIPFTGRFLDGSAADLGLWSMKTGMVTLRSLSTGRLETFRWGGREGDVLVPGDYDGDGVDEIAVWQRTNTTWYWRDAPKGPISQATFGTATCIPVPADYDHDGRMDLAYWEPREGRIMVTFTEGRSVNLVVAVPPHSIPAFVNWY